jgi:isopenicillin N synthase-like dioxygenase
MEYHKRIAQMQASDRALVAKISGELACDEELQSAPTKLQRRIVPVIDLAGSDEECAEQLWQACAEIGFFKLANHGIPEDDIEEMFLLDQQVMALPQETKETRFPFSREEIRGYECSQIRPSTGTPDQKESLLIPARSGAMDGTWPSASEGLPDFENRTRAFIARCHALSLRVVGLLERKLGMERGTFSRTHTLWTPNSKCVHRLLHYPPVMNPGANPDNVWRAGAHTDFSTLTLLFQRPGETGLECASNPRFRGQDGIIEFTPVDPEPGCISCNIGNFMMRLSGDRLLSNLHRVRMPPADSTPCSRYSMAFFLQPDEDLSVETIEHGALLAKDVMQGRMLANWGSQPREPCKEYPTAA